MDEEANSSGPAFWSGPFTAQGVNGWLQHRFNARQGKVVSGWPEK